MVHRKKAKAGSSGHLVFEPTLSENMAGSLGQRKERLPECLLDSSQGHILAKFIVERPDPDCSDVFRSAA
jgi:hypothetical protein